MGEHLWEQLGEHNLGSSPRGPLGLRIRPRGIPAMPDVILALMISSDNWPPGGSPCVIKMGEYQMDPPGDPPGGSPYVINMGDPSGGEPLGDPPRGFSRGSSRGSSQGDPPRGDPAYP